LESADYDEMKNDWVDVVFQAYERGRKLTPEEAQGIEAELNNEPNKLVDRLSLIAYLTELHFNGEGVEAIRSRRAQHIFWLIEHVPDHPALADGECEVLSGIDANYSQFKVLWQQQIEKHQSNPLVLANAAHAVLIEDGELAETLLTECERMLPNHPDWSLFLSVIYEIRAQNSIDAEQETRWNDLAQQCKERCQILRRQRMRKAMRDDGIARGHDD